MKASPDLIADVSRIKHRFRSPVQETVTDRNDTAPIPSANDIHQEAQVSGNGNALPSNTPRGPISYLSFGMKRENFAELIGLLKKAPQYVPVEDDLSIKGLEARLQQLKSVHEAVNALTVTLRTAQKRCRRLVFGEDGIYGVGMRVKDYYISAFGFDHEKVRTISKIKFVK